jgi:putative flippase GtrA
VRIDVRRWGVFNLVGFGGFVVQIGAITVLTRVLGWSPVVATLVALELAALQNFIGHSRWTWGDVPVDGVRSWPRRYWRYQAAKTASLGANLAMTTGLIYLELPPEAANTAAVLVCAIPNYLLADQFVFHQSS